MHLDRIIPMDRRITPGVAIVTQRSRVKARYAAAGIPTGVYVVQGGNTWPCHRPPVILDTIGMDPTVLTHLLVAPPDGPVIVVADPADACALRLCALCGVVRVIGPDDPAAVRPWLRHLPGMIAPPVARMTIAWLVPQPPMYRLDAATLPILAALLSCATMADVAAQVGMVESTLHRQLRTIRRVLDLPLGNHARYRPADLGRNMLARLGAATPVCNPAV